MTEQAGAGQALQGTERLDPVLLERLLAKSSERLSVLAAPAALDMTVTAEGTEFDRITEVAQAVAPLVILDLPHVWSAWPRRALLSADEVVITAEPTLLGLRNVRNLCDFLTANRPNDPNPHVLINKIGVRRRSEIKPVKFAAALGFELAAQVPFDAASFSAAANEGQPAMNLSPRSAAAREIRGLADRLCGGSMKRRRGFSLAQFWRR